MEVLGSLRQQLGAGLREQLGEILVRKGRITHEQLADALAQATAGERVGQALVRLGYIFEEDLAQALADQFGLRYIALDPRHLDRQASTLLPEEVARELDAVLLRVGGGCAAIAVADPTDILAADTLRMVVGMEVDLGVSERSAIHAAIDHVYTNQIPQFELQDTGSSSVTPIAPAASIDETTDDAAPAIEAVNALLRRALALGASDVHFVPSRNALLVRARVDGVLRDIQTIPAELQAAVIARLKIMGQLDIAERRLPQDGRVAITLEDVELDLRIAVLPTTWGEEVVLRILYLTAGEGRRSLDDLGLDARTDAILRTALRQPSGAIIVCGPTGSGKTTTLYAALSELQDGRRAIITIEDPVEAAIEGIVQVNANPRVGLTFARGLRTILRADPDVILVGEIRDPETAEIAMRAAMTGHLVLSTLHAESAAAAVARLENMGVSPHLMASALRCIVSQRLVRRLCKSCQDRRASQASGDGDGRVGCADCSWTEYAGRVGVYEALAVDDAIRATFDQPPLELARAARDAGLTPLRESASELVRSGVTTLEEVERVCGDG